MSPTKFPHLTERDLKLTACAIFAHNDLDIPHLKTPALRLVSAVFRQNISRIRLMMLVPAHLSDLSLRMQHLIDLATLEITGTITGAPPPEKEDQISERWRALFNAHLETLAKDREAANWQKEALVSLEESSSLAEMLGSVPVLGNGLEAMLSFYLTGVWTAFETMCGDLWESAVNAYPGRLAHLKGTSSRLVKTGKTSNDDEDKVKIKKPETVPLDQLKRHQFDVKNKMGTILRNERFEFSRLRDIRLAYGQAFDRDFSKIEDALMDKSIETLRMLRNLIVHQGGRAESDYAKTAKALKLPLPGSDGLIILDGAKVIELISPVIENASRLLSAVDAWVIKHGRESGDAAEK
jgi:hypothetical protein